VADDFVFFLPTLFHPSPFLPLCPTHPGHPRTWAVFASLLQKKVSSFLLNSLALWTQRAHLLLDFPSPPHFVPSLPSALRWRSSSLGCPTCSFCSLPVFISVPSPSPGDSFCVLDPSPSPALWPPFPSALHRHPLSAGTRSLRGPTHARFVISWSLYPLLAHPQVL